MANNKQVKIGIGFDVDKNGLKELENIQNQLRDIAAWGSQTKGTNEFTKGLKEAGQTASKLYDILEKSYSANLGTVNVTKFKQELDKAGISVKTMKQDLAKAGAQGNAAFASLGSALLNTNVQLKKSNTLLDEMAQTMTNTVKWGVTSSIFNNISSSVQDAFHYVKQLDSSLNDIRIVTDKSAESMAKFAVQANNAAKNLGASTRDFSDAALIYYQQGLSDSEAQARAEVTLKAANVTGQRADEVSEQLTSVWNGYKVSAQEAELYIDKLAAVAATTASDLEELSTGMSKVASAASLMGVDIDQLNAQLATIVSVTRQAPESVGTALKTIYARMGDIEAGLDTETTLGNYTSEMAAMGVNVLDANGKLRDMGVVIEEIGGKWKSMSREQQIALSQTMAGTRQYNNLLSLFDNWDMYTEALNTSADAAGTLQHQQDIYMESTAAHLQILTTTAEDLYDTLIKPEEVNALLDTFTNGIDVLGSFFDTFGGGVKSMAAGAIILSSVFNKQIGEGLINFQKNKYQEQSNLDVINTKKELVQKKIDRTGNETIEERAAIAKYETEAKYAKEILKLKNGITNEDYEQMTSIQAKIGALTEEVELHKKIAEEKKKEFQKKYDNEELNFDDIDDKVNSLIENLEIEKERLQELQQNDDVPSSVIKEQKQEIKNLQEKVSLLQQIREENNAAQSAERQRSAQETDFAVMQQNAEKAATLNNGITLVTSSLSVLATTWGAFQSLGSIWADEDLSFGDKLAQTFGLLVTSGGLLINSVSQIQDAYSGLTEIFGENIEAAQVKNKVLKMLGLTEAMEAAATNKQTTANAAKIVSEVADAGATDKTEDETEELARAEEDEARATLKQAAANKIKDTTEKGKKKINEVLKLDQKGSVGSNLKNLVQGGKDAVLPQLTGYLTKIIGLIKSFAGPLAIATVSIVAVKSAVALYNSALKDSAKSAKEAANAQDEVIQKTKEQYENVKSAKEAYEEVKKQYEDNEINVTQLRLKIIDICKQHNLEAEAVRAKTASYEDLLEILNDVKSVNASDLAVELNQGIEDYSKAIETDIWANQVKGSSRDNAIGLGKSIDVGAVIGPFDDLNKTLKKYNVEFNALTGHISLDSLIDVFKKDGQAFLNDLGENSSKTSAKLLEIVNSQKESIDKIQDYNDQIKQLDEDKILKESYEPYKNQGGFKSFEEYNNAANQAAKSLLAEGHAKSWEEALEKARAYYTYVEDKIAQDASGSLAISGADEKDAASTKEENLVDEYFGKEDWQELAESGYFEEEGNLENVLKSMYSTGVQLGKTKEQIESDIAALEASLEAYQKDNPEGNYSNFLDYSKEKQTKNAEIQMRFMDLAKSQGQGDLINYLDEEDWNEIFSLEDDSDQQLATFKALMETSLEKYKANFSTTHAQDFATVLTDIGNIGLFGDAEMLETSSSFTQLIENVDTLKAAFPELASAFDVLTDSGKAGTEEWLNSLEKVQGIIAATAEDPTNDGIFSKEDAVSTGATVEGLEEAYAQGTIDDKTYNARIKGTKLADAERHGYTEEDVQAAEELVQDYLELSEVGEKVSKNLKEHPKLAEKMAAEVTRVRKGVKDLQSNWDEYNEALKSGLGNPRYSKAIEDIKDNLLDILDTSESDAGWLTDDFVTKNLEDIKAAAEGDADAIDRLRISAAEEIVTKASIELDEGKADLFVGDLNEITSMLDDVANEDIQIGASIDDSAYAETLFKMMQDAGMTSKQIADSFNEIGWEPEVEQRQYTLTDKDVRNGYVEVPSQLDAEGLEYGTQKIPISSSAAVDSTISYTVIKGKKSSGGGFTPTMTKKAKASQAAPSSSKKGGGGGGSKGKKAEKKKDFFEDEVDIYHEINTQLDILEKNYDKLAKAQEKLTGKALVDNLKAQTEAINDQIEALKTKRQIAEQEARTIKKDELKSNKSETEKLQKQYDKLSKKEKNSKKGKKLQKKINKSKDSDLYSGNLAIQYTDQGTIANYDEVLKSEQAAIQKMEKKYNSLIDKYKDKKGNVSEAEQKKLDKYNEKIEKAKQNYEELKASMDSYDELMAQTIAEIDQEMRDLYDQKIEIQIETFDSSLKLRLDSSQLERDYNDFLKEINEDDEHGLVEDMQINKASLTTYQTDIEQTKNKLNEALAAYETIKGGGIDATFGDNAAAALEKVKEYQELLNEQTLDYKELQREIKEQYLDLLDTMNEQLDEQYEAYEKIDEELEHLANIQSKLFGEKAYDDMNEIITAQQKNNKAQIEAKKKEIAEQEKIKAAALEGNDEWEKANDRILAAQSDIRNLTETSLDLALAKYENSVNKIFDDAEKRIAGMSFEDADKEWESFSTYDSEFLDKINRAYGENSFKERVQSEIDNTNSIRTKEILNSLLDDELNKLKEKNKLTQYDVDRANKMLDITLKQIALEEAQNNKSKMRLRRDSQGNYSYQYVADQDNVNQLQNELDKAKNELYNFDKDTYKENVQKVKNQYAAMQEELKELALSEKYKSADEATQEQMKQDVVNRHQGIIEGLVESNNRIRANITSSALDEAIAEGVITQEEYDAKTEQQKQEWMDELVGIWDSGYQHIATILNGEGGFSAQVVELMDSVNKEVAQFQTTVSDTLGTSGETTSEWAKIIDEEWGALTKEGGAIDSVNKGFDKILKTFMGDEKGEGGLVTAAQATLKGVNNLTAGFTAMEAEASKAAIAAKEAITLSNNENASAADDATANNTVENSEPPKSSTINEDNKGDTKSTSKENILEKGDHVTVTKKADIYKKDSKGKFKKTSKDAKKGSGYDVYDVKKSGKTTYAKISKKDNKWIKKSYITGFDTGGYTGRWNSSEGRLALLHQKELVLNAKDTENMLRMTKITRQMMRDMNPELLQRQYEEMTNSLKVANNKEWKIAKNQMLNELQALSTFKEEMAKKIVDMEATNYSFAEITQSIMNKMQEDIMAKYNFTIDKIKNQVAEFKHSQKEKDVIDQKVHIEATFPNVSHSREIEDAFNNLINIAAQRAYNTKRLK